MFCLCSLSRFISDSLPITSLTSSEVLNLGVVTSCGVTGDADGVVGHFFEPCRIHGVLSVYKMMLGILCLQSKVLRSIRVASKFGYNMSHLIVN